MRFLARKRSVHDKARAVVGRAERGDKKSPEGNGEALPPGHRCCAQVRFTAASDFTYQCDTKESARVLLRYNRLWCNWAGSRVAVFESTAATRSDREAGSGFPDAIKGGDHFTTPMPARANTCCGF